mmetsp:Transcript_13625/g.32989  ORF Transcript_13625/g.32989 Transcript_13625/m.32989 type:complete len:230 (-) Transcript_13625:189-878(-)
MGHGKGRGQGVEGTAPGGGDGTLHCIAVREDGGDVPRDGVGVGGSGGFEGRRGCEQVQEDGDVVREADGDGTHVARGSEDQGAGFRELSGSTGNKEGEIGTSQIRIVLLQVSSRRVGFRCVRSSLHLPRLPLAKFRIGTRPELRPRGAWHLHPRLPGEVLSVLDRSISHVGKSQKLRDGRAGSRWAGEAEVGWEVRVGIEGGGRKEGGGEWERRRGRWRRRRKRGYAKG